MASSFGYHQHQHFNSLSSLNNTYTSASSAQYGILSTAQQSSATSAPLLYHPDIDISPSHNTTFPAMAAFTLMFAPTSAVFGRSGYNKDGDEEGENKGRSGYNKSGDEEGKDQGRSGYNKGDDDDDEGDNKGRSGYNDEEDK